MHLHTYIHIYLSFSVLFFSLLFDLYLFDLSFSLPSFLYLPSLSDVVCIQEVYLLSTKLPNLPLTLYWNASAYIHIYLSFSVLFFSLLSDLYLFDLSFSLPSFLHLPSLSDVVCIQEVYLLSTKLPYLPLTLYWNASAYIHIYLSFSVLFFSLLSDLYLFDLSFSLPSFLYLPSLSDVVCIQEVYLLSTKLPYLPLTQNWNASAYIHIYLSFSVLFFSLLSDLYLFDLSFSLPSFLYLPSLSDVVCIQEVYLLSTKLPYLPLTLYWNASAYIHIYLSFSVLFFSLLSDLYLFDLSFSLPSFLYLPSLSDVVCIQEVYLLSTKLPYLPLTLYWNASAYIHIYLSFSVLFFSLLSDLYLFDLSFSLPSFLHLPSLSDVVCIQEVYLLSTKLPYLPLTLYWNASAYIHIYLSFSVLFFSLLSDLYLFDLSFSLPSFLYLPSLSDVVCIQEVYLLSTKLPYLPLTLYWNASAYIHINLSFSVLFFSLLSDLYLFDLSFSLPSFLYLPSLSDVVCIQEVYLLSTKLPYLPLTLYWNASAYIHIYLSFSVLFFSLLSDLYLFDLSFSLPSFLHLPSLSDVVCIQEVYLLSTKLPYLPLTLYWNASAYIHIYLSFSVLFFSLLSDLYLFDLSFSLPSFLYLPSLSDVVCIQEVYLLSTKLPYLPLTLYWNASAYIHIYLSFSVLFFSLLSDLYLFDLSFSLPSFLYLPSLSDVVCIQEVYLLSTKLPYLPLTLYWNASAYIHIYLSFSVLFFSLLSDLYLFDLSFSLPSFLYLPLLFPMWFVYRKSIYYQLNFLIFL